MDTAAFTFDEIFSACGGEWIGPFEPAATVSHLFTDTRENVPDSIFIALPGERFDAHDFLENAIGQGAKLLCIDAKKKAKLPARLTVPALAVNDTVAAYQALAHLHRMRFPRVRVLALTGSCGKTSTKETLRAIFEAAFGADHVLATEGNTNNQLGVPRNLLRLNDAHRVAVIETGTNHPGEIEPLARCIRPEGAMIVSIGRCHLEFLGSLEGVAREKSHLFDFLPANGFAAIPAGAAGFDIMQKAASARTKNVVAFGPGPKTAFTSKYLGGNLHGSAFELTKNATGETRRIQWNIPGAHQANNAAGAAALADAFGIPFDTIAAGIANTRLPGMRMRLAKHAGATWINDAYNANPDSMKASLEWLAEFADPASLVLALGDMGELGTASGDGHRSVLESARRLLPGARLFTVGEKMRLAASALAVPPEKCYVSSDAAALDFRSRIRPGDTVFLKASRSTQMEKLEPAGEA